MSVPEWSSRMWPRPASLIAVAVALVVISFWSTVVAAHEPNANTTIGEHAVPFVAAIGISATIGLSIGLLAVLRCRRQCTDAHPDHGPVSRLDVTALLVVLGMVALLSALTQQWSLALVGGVVGGVLTWLGRDHGVSPHGGCADVALGAILAHRTVEGALVASIYAASAALGLLGITLLTVHMLAETIAVGGLYAPVSRWWGIGSVVAVQLGFVGGAIAGSFLTGVLSAAVTTTLLAAIGGVLFVAGITEFRMIFANRRGRPHA